jgi:amino acid transporter
MTTFQATALNMANMIGAGPFITLPLLMTALPGPQALLGLVIAALITLPDALVWSELGAAMPASGGTYAWLREGFGRDKWGRAAAFLFLWQFLGSGPFEIATGYIGIAQYLDYLWPGMTEGETLTARGGLVVVGLGLLNLALLWRNVRSVGRLGVALWVGAMAAVAIVILAGATHFNPATAFDAPPVSMRPQTLLAWLVALGAAARIGVYDLLGYYDACFLGDELKNPGRTIPRAVIGSLALVTLIYLAVNLSINGVVSWREFTPADKHPDMAHYLGSIFIERLYGKPAAAAFTLLIVWTALASVFALLLGYSRIPYAAARDGAFFRVFARVHPSGHFPWVSLLAVGVVSVGASFLSLGAVIDAMLALRFGVQFLGQIAALVILRRTRADLARPYRVWWYPLPLVVAGAGWTALLVTSPLPILQGAAGAMAAGVIAFLAWAATGRHWPFDKAGGVTGR